ARKGLPLRDRAGARALVAALLVPVAQRSQPGAAAEARRRSAGGAGALMATVRLHLRGISLPHVLAAGISALPAGYVGFQMAVHHAQPTTLLIALSGAVAFVPWLSRAAARATYRAKCDDIAVHVRGEALPYKTIKELQVIRTPRRRAVRLIRSEE